MQKLPHTLYRAEQVRELDRLAIEDHGLSGATLMARAGAAAFAVLCARWPSTRRITVICGIGNNAGDGFVLARLAQQAGWDVSVVQLGDAGCLRGDALAAREAWLTSGGSTIAFAGEIAGTAEVLVDALLGTGLKREVSGEWKDVIEAMNASGIPVLALDIPSGLDADKGCVLGAAVKAEATISFIGLKQGMFTGQAPDYCGTIIFDDLGVPPELFSRVPASAARINLAGLPVLKPRPRTAHKGDAGHVLVIGGEQGMGGAVRMAAEAAARVGAGLVTVATRAEHVPGIIAARPELLCCGIDDVAQMLPLIKVAHAIAIGPGLGRTPWAIKLFAAVLEARLPLVVDADALNLLALEPVAREHWVLTPHPGEAARLLGCSVTTVQADRFGAITELQKRFGGTIVLKGAGTLVWSGAGAIDICDAGNPGMASGGMGDVLTGVIAGLIAQGLELAEAARRGVCLHAAAGDQAAQAGERGMLAGDLLPYLRQGVNFG